MWNRGMLACGGYVLRLLIGALRDLILSRGRLEAEVIVLRHQLNILRRRLPRRVRPNAFDRAIFVCLYRHFPDIGNAVAIIRPETVFAGVVALEVSESRRPTQARPGIARSGAPHVRGKSTMGRAANPRRTAQAGLHCRAVDGFKIHAPRTKTAFARLEDISAQSRRWVDFLVVPTLSFERLFAFVILGVG